MDTRTQQQKLNHACKEASGDGVGFVAVICQNALVVVRRDEEFARSTEHNFATVEDAIAYLHDYAQG